MKTLRLTHAESAAYIAGERRFWRAMKPQPTRAYRMPPTGMGAKTGQVFIGPDNLGDNLVLAYCIEPGVYHVMGSRSFTENHSPYGKPGDRITVSPPIWADTITTIASVEVEQRGGRWGWVVEVGA